MYRIKHGALPFIMAALSLLHSTHAHASEPDAPYTLERALSEDQAWAIGGVELLSEDRAIGTSGCFDISGDEPIKLNEFGTIHLLQNDDPTYTAITGEARLLAYTRTFDRDRRLWTQTLAKVGCAEPVIFYQNVVPDGDSHVFGLADLLPSASRPLTLVTEQGLSRLDHTSPGASPTLWLGDEAIWQGLISAHGKIPSLIAAEGTLEQVALVDARIYPLDADTSIAQLRLAMRFEGEELATHYAWLVTLEEDGEIDIVLGPRDPSDVRLLPAKGAIWWSGLAIPLQDLPGEQLRARSFPIDQRLRMMLSYDRDEPYRQFRLDGSGRIVTDARYIATHEAYADFDRDGLSAARERELGTHDANPDSDGDGLMDGVEVAFGREPAAPEPVEAGRSIEALGLSNTIMEWAPMSLTKVGEQRLRRDMLSHFFYPFDPDARVTCRFPLGASRTNIGWKGTCFDHELEELAAVDVQGTPYFTSAHELYSHQRGWIDIRTGEAVQEPIDIEGSRLLGQSQQGSLISTKNTPHPEKSEVTYHPRSGDDPITLQMKGTPVDGLWTSWVNHLGHSRDGTLEFFGVSVYLGQTGSSEEWLYAVRDEEIFGLFSLPTLLIAAGVHTTDLDAYAMGQLVAVDEPGGYIFRVDEVNTRNSLYITLDEQLRPTGAWGLPRVGIGAWWREGFISLNTYRHRVALSNNGNPDTRCVNLGGVIACDAEPGRIAMSSAEIDETIYQQLVPLLSGLGPHDVLMNVHQDGLWRYTPEGAMAPWITPDALEQLRREAGIFGDLGRITNISIRRDRGAVCVVAGGEVYAIHIGGRGTPQRLERVAETQGRARACAWDDAQSGSVAWTDDAGDIHLDGKVIGESIAGEVLTLVSTKEGGWLALDNLGLLRCLDANGDERRGISARGVALFDEQLVYVDTEFNGMATISLEGLCGGDEQLAPIYPDWLQRNFWTQMYETVQNSILPSHRVNTRLTGIAVVAQDQIVATLLDYDTNAFVGTVARVPFRLRPAYHELSERSAAILGELPYNKGMMFRGAPYTITAIASSPNASLARSTRYYSEPEAPPEQTQESGEGEDGPAPGSGQDAGGVKGTACHVAPRGRGGAPLILTVLLSMLAWRRRRRGAEDAT